uniref:Uncharacterized protein n=1 Tax=Palpitomonas bilix TaxID=652834 RepID=A0A7S3DEA7_9EUKA
MSRAPTSHLSQNVSRSLLSLPLFPPFWLTLSECSCFGIPFMLPKHTIFSFSHFSRFILLLLFLFTLAPFHPPPTHCAHDIFLCVFSALCAGSADCILRIAGYPNI